MSPGVHVGVVHRAGQGHRADRSRFTTSGSFRWRGGGGRRGELEENSPKLPCALRCSIKQNTARSQNRVDATCPRSLRTHPAG